MGFGPGDALRTTTFAGGLQSAGAIDAAGHVWLPSLKGLVIVDPAHLPGTGNPPAAIVEEVSMNGKALVAGCADRVAAGSGRALDPLWRGHAAQRRPRALPLPHGRHHAGVGGRGRRTARPRSRRCRTGSTASTCRATLDGKRWQDAAAPLPITVSPQFYQTWYFGALTALALGAAALGLFRLRTHQLRRRHAEMQRLVATKTEELRVANEHLSRLSLADSLTGLANRRHLDEVLEREWRRAQSPEGFARRSWSPTSMPSRPTTTRWAIRRATSR